MDLLGEELYFSFIAFSRLAPVFMFFPVLGEPVVPQRIKLALVLSLSWLLSDQIRLTAIISDRTLPGILLILISESIFGLFLGLFVRSTIYRVQVAGSAISALGGNMMIFNVGSEALPVIGQLLKYAALVTFVTTGIHLLALELLFEMYGLVPAGSFSCVSCVTEVLVSVLDKVFSDGIVLASGFASAMIVYNLYAGMINKAMPQFMVILVFAPGVMLFMLFFLQRGIILILTVWLEMSREALKMNWPI